MPTPLKPPITAADLHVNGIVQGVGFRPAVYKLAVREGLAGWVLNASDGVRIHLEGPAPTTARFAQVLRDEAPAAARIEQLICTPSQIEGLEGFTIKFSDADAQTSTLVSPDLATCPRCADELFDPANRRYHYPFINCTACGPRFTIIDHLPYDRSGTSMAGFAISSMRTNHCCFTMGSMVVLHRSCVPTLWEWGTIFTKSPCSSRSATMAFLAT